MLRETTASNLTTAIADKGLVTDCIAAFARHNLIGRVYEEGAW